VISRLYCMSGATLAGRPEIVTGGTAGGLTLMENRFEAVAPVLSVTVTVKEIDPADSIVPLINPEELMLSPAGNPLADQV
jgi:hypothetical protein